jgi:hypothetical protein
MLDQLTRLEIMLQVCVSLPVSYDNEELTF